MSSMYYEIVDVREYTKKATGKPYYTIGIRKKSKFFGSTHVAILDTNEVLEIEEKLDSLEGTVSDGKYNELLKCYHDLEDKVKQLEETIEDMESTSNELQTQHEEEISNWEEKVETLEGKLVENKDEFQTTKDNLLKKSNELSTIQQEHKEEVAILNNKLHELNEKLSNEKDYSRACILALNDSENVGLVKTVWNKLTGKRLKSVEMVTNLELMMSDEND